MRWHRIYGLRSYLRSTMWVVPVLAYIASFVLVRVVGYIDDWLHWQWAWKLEVGTVQYDARRALVASTISFIVFTFSSLLVAIQVAERASSRRASSRPRCCATTPSALIVALFVLTLASVSACWRARRTECRTCC